MKTLFQAVILCTAIGSCAYGQSLTPKYTLGIGIERAGLDAPDVISNRYLVRGGQHFRADRLVLEASLGYLNALNRRFLVNNFYVNGKRRERVTLDITGSFDFLKNPSHALRLGVGPSVWYKNEESLEAARFTLGSDGSVTNVRVQWQPRKELNYGFNVLLEYEYALTSWLALSGKLKFASVSQAGLSSIYGVGVDYRFF